MELTEESVTLKQNDFEIDLSSNNVQQLLDTIYKVQDVTEIPVGYNTVEEYKKAFVSQLVNTKGFDSLRDPIIFELCCDPIMFEFLLENTDKIENLFIKNYYYEKNAEIINKNCLKKIDINEVNKLLNKPKMKEYLSSLSPTEMASLCNNFSYVYYNALSSSNALIDILCTYNVNQLIEFGKSLEYKFIPDDISKSFNRENVFKFYNYLINQIYVPNNAGYLKLLEYQLFKHIIPDLDSIIRKNDSSFIDINKQLYNKNKQLLQQTSNSVISNAELDGLFSRTPGDVFYKVDEPWKKYEVKYEVDGKEFTTVLKSDILDQINLTDLMQSPEVSDAISRNAFIIKDIRFVDTGAYERMKLTSESGLKEGINYVTCRIDGKLKKIIVSGDNINLNNYYRDVNEFEIVNIDSIDSPNIVCNDTDIDKYLKVSYTIDGKEEVFYLSPSESDNQIVFNIADCIEQKHLFGATNFSTEIVDNVELTVNNIQELSSFNNIFNDIAYGGNQGDVPQIVFNYLKGNITNSIDKQKGKLMVDLIKSVFPSATDTEIVFIANQYAEVGCAYMSASNAFMTYIASLENGEEIFRERFGFDLKVSDSSTISYNLEALALDIYLRKVVQNKITLNSLGNIRRIDGVSKTTFHNDISGYFKEKGIILHYDRFSDGLNKNNAAFANMASNPNQMYILGTKGFDVELANDVALISSDHALDDMIQEGKIIRNIGPHSMLVTGIDEQGNLIVSTWGEKATIIGGKYQNDTTGLYEITSIWFEID